jgi:hypothetical protein
MWWDAGQSRRAIEALRAQKAAQEQAARDAQAATATPAPPKPYQTSAREFLQQHDTLWPRLLDAIEAVEIPHLRVVSLEYTASEQQARVEIVAAQQAQVLDYVTELNKGLPEGELAWRWSVVRIEQARETNGARAQLTARWGR